MELGNLKLKILPLLVLLTVGLSLFTCGCMDDSGEGQVNEENGNISETGSIEEPIIVAVSILPQEEFVEKVGGDRIKAVVMVPPGEEPATYEPTAEQLTEISKAKMYAIVGSDLPFEKVWMDKIESVNSEMLIVNCSEGIELREMAAHHHEGEEHETEENETEADAEGESIDPHVWTSPLNVKIMVQNIYEGLSEIDPDNESYYAANRDAYLEELDDLDARIKSRLEGAEGKNFMVFHPAWGYFADDYGLNMISIEIEGKEPSAQDLTNLINDAKENNVTVIFVQAQFSTQSAEAIAEEIGGEVVSVDPLAENYIENMDEVSEIFARNLA
jgi:zinc transport system substrate-binding protein